MGAPGFCGDGNENGKKRVALDWQNNSARTSRFDVHFLAYYDVTLPNFTFFEGRELELFNFYSSFLNFIDTFF